MRKFLKFNRKKAEAAFEKRGAFPGQPCGTENCEGVARWIPISEGNNGSRTYRCTDCCDEIDAMAKKNSP